MDPGGSHVLQMGKTRVFFLPRPVRRSEDLNKNIALVPIRFVGDRSTVHCPLKKQCKL